MLGIAILAAFCVLIHNLCKKYGKNSVLYIFLTIGVYVVSTVVLGILAFIFLDLINEAKSSFEMMLLNFVGLAISAGLMYWFYSYLEKKWEAKKLNEERARGKYDDEILEI